MGTELPSLPIYREISRKFSKINTISRSPDFDLQSPAKESFCIFLRVIFDFICRRTVLPAVSHLRYTKSAESSRADTIQDVYNRTFLIGQLTGNIYIQWPMETFVTYWVGISLAHISNEESAGGTMSEKSEKCLKKRKYDSKYKSEWASEFAGVVKGSEESRAKYTFCIMEFSVVHGGKNDIKKHCNSTLQLAKYIQPQGL